MIRRKPHTLSVDLPEEVIRNNILLGHSDDPQGSVRGMLVPTSSEAFYQQFAVETSRGHVFFCDVADAAKFAMGGRVTRGSEVYQVVKPPLVFDVASRCDHVQVPLERTDLG